MPLKFPLLTSFLLSVPVPPPSSHFSTARFPTQTRPVPILPTLTPIFSSSSNSSFRKNNDGYDEEEEHVIGDCLVFEEGAFEDPFHNSDIDSGVRSGKVERKAAVERENLVPDGWKEVQAEINMTKKEKRAIAKQLEFGSGLRKRKGTGLPPVEIDAEAYRSTMLAKLKPVVLDRPSYPLPGETAKTTTATTIDRDGEERRADSSVRVPPKDPRPAVAGSSLKDLAEFFNSDEYQPGENENKNSRGSVSCCLSKYNCVTG